MTETKTIKEKDITKEDKTLIKLRLTRNDVVKLYVKVSPEIETMFKSGLKEKSSNWGVNGEEYEFYRRQYTGELGVYMSGVFDSYGGAFIDNMGNINTGILRTVGLSEGKEFEIKERYSEETLIKGVRDLKKNVVHLYKNFVRPVKINMSLRIEEI